MTVVTSMNLGVLSPKLSRIMRVALHYIWILPLCMGTLVTVVETEQANKAAKKVMWNKSNPM